MLIDSDFWLILIEDVYITFPQNLTKKSWGKKSLGPITFFPIYSRLQKKCGIISIFLEMVDPPHPLFGTPQQIGLFCSNFSFFFSESWIIFKKELFWELQMDWETHHVRCKRCFTHLKIFPFGREMFSLLIQLYSETERYGRRPWSISYKGFVKDLWFQPIYNMGGWVTRCRFICTIITIKKSNGNRFVN